MRRHFTGIFGVVWVIFWFLTSPFARADHAIADRQGGQPPTRRPTLYFKEYDVLPDRMNHLLNGMDASSEEGEVNRAKKELIGLGKWIPDVLDLLERARRQNEKQFSKELKGNVDEVIKAIKTYRAAEKQVVSDFLEAMLKHRWKDRERDYADFLKRMDERFPSIEVTVNQTLESRGDMTPDQRRHILRLSSDLAALRERRREETRTK